MYRLETSQERDYLNFTLTGTLNAASDREVDEAIRHHCEEQGVGLALVDIRGAEGRLSALENHVAATTFRDRMGAAVSVVAIVDVAIHDANSEMFELTATNRGARVRFFLDDRAAAAWLRRTAAVLGRVGRHPARR
jgi:hypothetical protein